MTDVRVVIADDHPVVREGLAALLASLPDITVVGVVGNGRDAVREAVISKPDVVVMDLQMPDVDGFTATREIARAAPEVAVLVLTMFDDDDSVFAAMRAGARGYVLKGAEQEDISRSLRAVAAGDAIFSPGVAQRVLAYLSGPRTAAPPFPMLTGREREVLDLLASGMSSSAVATRLGVAGKTVSNHVSALLAKLQVADRAEAVARARAAGMGR